MLESWKSREGPEGQEDPEGSADLEGPGVLKAKMNRKEYLVNFTSLPK